MLGIRKSSRRVKAFQRLQPLVLAVSLLTVHSPVAYSPKLLWTSHAVPENDSTNHGAPCLFGSEAKILICKAQLLLGHHNVSGT